jgi:hypothetical protein
MLVACLWSRSSGNGEPDLKSFAAITDEPPPEIAAAGNDRCIIAVRPPTHRCVAAAGSPESGPQYAILDDRERPYCEHRLAAQGRFADTECLGAAH